MDIDKYPEIPASVFYSTHTQPNDNLKLKLKIYVPPNNKRGRRPNILRKSKEIKKEVDLNGNSLKKSLLNDSLKNHIEKHDELTDDQQKYIKSTKCKVLSEKNINKKSTNSNSYKIYSSKNTNHLDDDNESSDELEKSIKDFDEYREVPISEKKTPKPPAQLPSQYLGSNISFDDGKFV